MRHLWLLTNRHLIKSQLNHKSILKLISLNELNSSRFLSTSKRLKYAHDPLPPADPKKYGGDPHHYLDLDIRLRPPPPKTIDDFANPDKTGHWFSYGFDEVDKKADRYWARVTFFFVLSVFFPIMGFYFMYEPDNRRIREWVAREAYLELYRREKYGLPLVDPDYVPRDKIILPEEEDINIEVHM